MKISELIEKLERAKTHIGDIEIYAWDSSSYMNDVFEINTVNYEGDHLELTQ